MMISFRLFSCHVHIGELSQRRVGYWLSSDIEISAFLRHVNVWEIPVTPLGLTGGELGKLLEMLPPQPILEVWESQTSLLTEAAVLG